MTRSETAVPINTDHTNTKADQTRVEDPPPEPELLIDSINRPFEQDDTAASGNEAAPQSQNDDEADEPAQPKTGETSGTKKRRIRWTRIIGYGILPGLILILTAGVGYLKWQDGIYQQSQAAAVQSVASASDTAVAILSYQPDTADKELPAATVRLTGSFRDDYTKLINELVIPGAQQKHILVTATVPEAASVSATKNHAVVLAFVNQTTTIGNDPPTDNASSVLITLDKEGDKWLVSKFDPI